MERSGVGMGRKEKRARGTVPHRSWEALAPPRSPVALSGVDPTPAAADELAAPRPPARVDQVYDVDVTYVEPDPDDPADEPAWVAEGGLRGASSGVDFDPAATLAELMRA